MIIRLGDKLELVRLLRQLCCCVSIVLFANQIGATGAVEPQPFPEIPIPIAFPENGTPLRAVFQEVDGKVSVFDFGRDQILFTFPPGPFAWSLGRFVDSCGLTFVSRHRSTPPRNWIDVYDPVNFSHVGTLELPMSTRDSVILKMLIKEDDCNKVVVIQGIPREFQISRNYLRFRNPASFLREPYQIVIFEAGLAPRVHPYSWSRDKEIFSGATYDWERDQLYVSTRKVRLRPAVDPNDEYQLYVDFLRTLFFSVDLNSSGRQHLPVPPLFSTHPIRQLMVRHAVDDVVLSANARAVRIDLAGAVLDSVYFPHTIYPYTSADDQETGYIKGGPYRPEQFIRLHISPRLSTTAHLMTVHFPLGPRRARFHQNKFFDLTRDERHLLVQFNAIALTNISTPLDKVHGLFDLVQEKFVYWSYSGLGQGGGEQVRWAQFIDNNGLGPERITEGTCFGYLLAREINEFRKRCDDPVASIIHKRAKVLKHLGRRSPSTK